MAIVASDLHCNLHKIKTFLAYKPEEQHVFAGDVLDSFAYTFSIAMDSLKTLVESDCVLLWGNHDISYRAKRPFSCSGYRLFDSPVFQQYIEANIKRFKIAHCGDDYLITHAGLSDYHYKKFSPFTFDDNMAAYLNTEPKGVFDIGKIRGGFQEVGGPLWYDFRFEEGLSKKYNQVFGHCCLKEPWEEITNVFNPDDDLYWTYHHVCINTYEGNPELYIFDTSTRKIERIDK